MFRSFRPYGGIIIREDINKYFDMNIDSRYMNVVVMNKTNKFPAITHIDNSTRIQTVTKEQDSFMYNLLKSYESVSGYPIMLNTSFNVAGKPIINRLSDAFDMLGNRKIDGLIVDDLFFSNS
jgi:carbamoyltransferase